MASIFHFEWLLLHIGGWKNGGQQKLRVTSLKNIALEVAWLLMKFATIWKMGDKQKNLVIKFLKKMKNGIHLDVAEFSKLKPNYLKSVKKIGLGKQFQVSGYFSLEQKSFLWIVPWDYFRSLIRYIKKQWTNKQWIHNWNKWASSILLAIANYWYIYVEIIRAIK